MQFSYYILYNQISASSDFADDGELVSVCYCYKHNSYESFMSLLYMLKWDLSTVVGKFVNKVNGPCTYSGKKVVNLSKKRLVSKITRPG